MMRRQSRYAAWALATMYASPGLADDTSDIESLLDESVVTTASRSAQKASLAPGTSVTFTAEDLKLYGLRTLAEAINFLSVGVITQDPLRTPDIGARGVLLPNDDGKHFLLLIDGHAINDPLYGAARFDQGVGVPIDIIDHVEVIVGPGSVLYGSNAMLGVINVITKEARDYRGGHVFGEYEPDRSARGGAGAGFSFDLFGQPAGVTTSIEYYERFGPDLEFDERQFPRNPGTGELNRFRRGGPADGIWGGTLENAYFTQASSGILRLRLRELEVSVLASAYRRGIPYTAGSLNVDFDDQDSEELDRSLRIDVKHEATLSPLVQLNSRLYGDSFDYQRRANRVAIYGCFQGFFETCQYYDAGLARWAGIEERLSLNWLEDLSLVTMFGVDARMRWVSAKEDPIDFETGRLFAPAVGRIRDSGAIISPYLQQTWSPTRWLDLNAGARVDIDSRFSPIVSPRGALALSPSRKTTLKAAYSQAFRAPTWNETDSATYHQAAAGRLEPEIVRSVEGSIEQRFSTQRLMFGVFRSWWENLVEPRVLTLQEQFELQRRGQIPITASGIVQYRNVSDIENYGFNASFNGTLADGQLRYGLNATEAFTRRESAGASQPLVVAPQLFGNAHVAYVFGGHIPTPALAASYVGRRPADRANEGFSPVPYAPATLALRGTLSGDVPELPGLGYRVSSAYTTASRGPYVPGPPLSIQTVGSAATYTPVDEISVFVGLRYDFLTDAGPAVAESP